MGSPGSWWQRIRGRTQAAATLQTEPGRRSGVPDSTTPSTVAVEAERLRIYRDLHDDIGARLVSILHSASEPQVQELARLALHDLREVVYHARAEPGSLGQIFGEIRAELTERLHLAGWKLEWADSPMPDQVLPGERALHLYRIVREAATNALKHSNSGVLQVRTRHVDGAVYIEITDLGERWHDDHPGPDPARGSGLATMQSRASRLGGALELRDATLQGTKVLLRFPIDPS